MPRVARIPSLGLAIRCCVSQRRIHAQAGRMPPAGPLTDGQIKAIDDWVAGGAKSSAVTCDGRLSAHFEHSVAITEKGPWILSRA